MLAAKKFIVNQSIVYLIQITIRKFKAKEFKQAGVIIITVSKVFEFEFWKNNK